MPLFVAVLVALIGAIGVVVAAYITTIRPAKANAIEAKVAASDAASSAQTIVSNIGTPNGKGNVVQMLERALKNQDRLSGDLAKLHETVNIVGASVADVRERTAYVEGTLGIRQANPRASESNASEAP